YLLSQKNVLRRTLSPDGAYLAFATPQYAIMVHDVIHGLEMHSLTGHHAEVTGLAFSPDRRWLVSGGRDKAVRLWHRKDGQAAGHFEDPSGEIERVAFSTDGGYLLAIDKL